MYIICRRKQWWWCFMWGCGHGMLSLTTAGSWCLQQVLLAPGKFYCPTVEIHKLGWFMLFGVYILLEFTYECIVCACLHVLVCKSIYVYMFVYLYVYTLVYVYLCVCMFVYSVQMWVCLGFPLFACRPYRVGCISSITWPWAGPGSEPRSPEAVSLNTTS